MGDYTCFMCQWQNNDIDCFIDTELTTDKWEKIYLCEGCFNDTYDEGNYHLDL
jgi:hypothetical protein